MCGYQLPALPFGTANQQRRRAHDKTPAPYGRLPQTDFEAQYRRVFEAAGCVTQTELADFLAIAESTVSDVKRRKTIPSAWFLKLFEEKCINPHWIRTGQGCRTMHMLEPAIEGSPFAGAADTERGPAQACSTEESLAELLRRALKKLG